MARFFVGQRVKLVRTLFGDPWPHREEHGTIVKLFNEVHSRVHNLDDGISLKAFLNCRVKWESEARICEQHTSQLEPILDANTKISWEECIWKPKPETV